jgi:quinoprotein glucose dehydrogenase
MLRLWPTGGLTILGFAIFFLNAQPEKSVNVDWPMHGGDAAGSHYSRLNQINTQNVHKLEPAWMYHTRDKRDDSRSQIQCNPIIIEGVLYGTSPQLKVFALNAATGQNLWTFDPFAAGADKGAFGVNRGVVYWRRGVDQRILFTAGQSLFALDAKTGKLMPEFGNNGAVDLREGLGRDVKKLFVGCRTPGAIYRDLLILGSAVSEGPGPAAPGHIRAYDVRTGKIRWIFHTIPHPGEFGYDTWPPDAWKRRGGANAWSGVTVDEEREMVFLPTGSASFDFWGGNRKGANLFANCVLALKADTGERVWHYQVVHHDLWDRDLPAAPNLVTVTRNGRQIDAVAQITKSGHVFVLDRKTGKPLFPVEERSVPASDLKGESSWPTQPLPLKPPPFSRQAFTEEEATTLSPGARAYVLERLRKVRTGQPFIPPSVAGTIVFPGFDGGGEWGGAAFDSTSSLLYINGNEMPWILTMVEISPEARSGHISLGQKVYNQLCAGCHGADREGDPQQVYPNLREINKRMSKQHVTKLIEGGKGMMPSFGFLASSEKEALVNFLFGLAIPDGPVPARKATKEKVEADIPYTHTGYNRFFDPEGYPAVKPPWGTLNAINLNEGTIEWRAVLGEIPELTRRGIVPTGTENYGGPVVTDGGLLFIGATKDERFRAFDKKTGSVLWETTLPAGGYATPATYMVNGKQFVVIAAGGGKMGTPSGDAYVAFALPDR